MFIENKIEKNIKELYRKNKLLIVVKRLIYNHVSRKQRKNIQDKLEKTL